LRITQEEAMKDNSAIIQVQLPVEAATFLLNEKRADIHKIEQRMGVEVVLIPNIHLETPNYNIVRIRHDDVTEDTTRASYKMVELPAETTYITNAAEEAKAVRPEAAVKGITPATSAPISVEKPAEKVEDKPSLIARIKSWFTAPAEKTETEKAEETRRDSNRNNRNRNRNRNDRNRNERGDKNANPNANRGNEAKVPAQGQQQKQQQPRNEQQRENAPKNEQNRNEQNRNANQVANTANTPAATPAEGHAEQRA
jgi:ribonuclease E